MICLTARHDGQVPCRMARKGDMVVSAVSFEHDVNALFEREITQDGFLRLASAAVDGRIVVLLKTWADGLVRNSPPRQ
jgi:hypothetical protein